MYFRTPLDLYKMKCINNQREDIQRKHLVHKIVFDYFQTLVPVAKAFIAKSCTLPNQN